MRFKHLFVLAISLLSFCAVATAQMTDEAVIAYVTQAYSQGKSQKEIAKELLSRGVPTDQLRRLFKEIKSGEAAAAKPESVSELSDINSVRRENLQSADSISTSAAERARKSEKKIFGHDIFRSRNLSFEPNSNAATPEDYVLGPGDEIIIDIWGVNEASIRRTISPEGRIMVSQIGSLQLSGLTIAQASGKIKSAMAKRYSGIGGSSPDSQISVTLGNIRTIQVNVMGAVNVPGTYRLSSFSTVFNALYRAGGVNDGGSIRNIRVMRAGETVGKVDLYSYIINGVQDSNISLKEGDVIVVPSYECLVEIRGGVKNPMFYEMKSGETLSDLIHYAGGFTGDAYADELKVVRYDGPKRRFSSVNAEGFSSFALKDSDEVNVSLLASAQKFYANRVEVRGAVFRPGFYELGGEIATVRQLVEHAGGLMEDAFLNRAQIIRSKDDLSKELLAIPIGAVIKGTAEDILLRNNDILNIFNINEIEPKGHLTVNGYVNNPGVFEYADNMSVEDIILLAGGFAEGASTLNVEVARRIINSSMSEVPDTIARIFTFNVSNGLFVDGKTGFVLHPNDVVSVRKVPSFIEQKIVTISGEVNYPGQYTITDNFFRMSDLINRAGGISGNADVHGAILKRRLNQYERMSNPELKKILKKRYADDRVSESEGTDYPEYYTVGIELDKAISNPDSDYDLILKDGDEIIVPEKLNTVKINGEVLFQNTVNFVSGKSLRYYIRQAGGFTERAKRRKSYVLYMNGTAATGLGAKIEPGCEIIVPAKSEKEKMSTAEILSMSSSAASIAAVVLTIINTLK